MFINKYDNKKYYTLNNYYKDLYNSKVFKVSLNTNLSCPNRENNKSGCIYCSKNYSGDFGGNPHEPLKVQFENIKNMLHKKWPKAKYIAYFQANTNTYAPLHTLKNYFEEVLTYDNVIGINIATRSDAISDEVLNYLSELNKRTDLTIELGLQSMHEETLKLIKRGHDLNNFETMYKKLKSHNIKIVVHIINGLPYETKEMMIETVKYLNNLNIDGIKIHMLHILKDTELDEYYKKNKFNLLSKDEYIDIVISQLEYLNSKVVIHRITGDPNVDDLVEPTWLVKKFVLLNDIDKEQKRQNSYQGKKCQKSL
ncbi:MAG: TIGR01212 family radical SAM protein [Mollicutes bacterium]|nr:TIGR01212 family radical SAM protein [Mollicutes bacterium]